MENGMLKVAAGGKRKRDGFLSEEDVKDNLKGQQQQWQQRPVRMDSGPKQQGFQYPQFQGPVVDNWNRMQQEQKIDVVATTANVPAFNMQQKVMAAPALQDLQSNDPSKLFLQSQLQQKQGKYGIQQQQQACSEPIGQLPALTTSPAARSLQEHSPSQLAQSPGLLPPLIQSSTLYAGSDLHNGAPPTSSSTLSSYSTLQNATVLRTCNNNPIQLLEMEGDQGTYSSMFHGSQNGFLQQGGVHSLKNVLPQQSLHSSSNVVLQQPSVHNAQIGIVHQQGGGQLSSHTGTLQQQQGSQNRPQSSASQTQNGQGAPVNGTSQHSSHTSQRVVHQKSANHALQNGLQNGMQMGLESSLQTGLHGDLQNGMMQQQGAAKCLQNVQQQGGHASQHLPQGHLSQNGIQNRMPQQEGFSGGNNALLREPLPVPTSWYSSVHEPCTYTGAQPNGSASHLQQRIDRPSTSGSSMGGGPIYSPSVPEFGTQRGLVSMPQGQLGQCQGIHRDGDAEQESQTQFDTQNPLVSLGSTKSCSLVTTRQSKVHSLRSEVHGERSVQGPYCSSSSSGVEPSPFNTLSANANEGLDNSLFLQGGASCPPKVVRSFTKVYKLGSITRAINVNRFSNYVELQRELVDMFNLECQLDQEHGWQLVFRDNEDDLLLVGDDPWEVFVSTVRAIHILSPAEVNFYLHEQNPGLAYNSFGGGTSKQQ